ncbi:MAG: 3'-5' exonuclease [Bacteroidales bacterium]|jgi:hypothetical protein|nr:3'-5' exonuclease [Bacteroidales bacterium]
MLTDVKVEDVLFLDIETVPQVSSAENLDEKTLTLLDRKSRFFRTPEQKAEEVWERAGIYAEFGKIICISVGFVRERNPYSFRIKSFFGDDEKLLLTDFSGMLAKFCSGRKEALLCAHNGREFDFPFIARRMVINGMVIPDILDNAGKKPWEVKMLDTMELWKFGDYKSFTSLELLTHILGIPSPKDDIDGSMVAGIYYVEKDMPRVVRYCEKDVLAIARILLRFMNKPGIPDESVESVTLF